MFRNEFPSHRGPASHGVILSTYRDASSAFGESDSSGLVNVSNFCLSLELEPALRPWMSRLARLDCFLDKTQILMDLVADLRLHPRGMVSWADVSLYFTRAGWAARFIEGSGGDKGGGGGAPARQRSPGGPSRPAGGGPRSPAPAKRKAGPPLARGRGATAKSKAAPSSASKFAAPKDPLQSSLDAKTQRALLVQNEDFPAGAKQLPSAGGARSAGGEPPAQQEHYQSSLILGGLRYLCGLEFGDLDTAYRTFDNHGDGWTTGSTLLQNLKACAPRFDDGLKDGSLEGAVLALRRTDMQISLSELLGIPVPGAQPRGGGAAGARGRNFWSYLRTRSLLRRNYAIMFLRRTVVRIVFATIYSMDNMDKIPHDHTTIFCDKLSCCYVSSNPLLMVIA